ncbi:MAG: protoporphyrinogen oxidase HemJ [Alphaproteobacteria bacterium]|nr:protoporphyrinogen oxidase HemJ [Alphaproteobacteria bacterium]
MSEFIAVWYDWIKALHVIAVIAWMAGLLYLPRLFVYHCAAAPGSELSETLKNMERRLLRAIMNPAQGAVFLFGGMLAWVQDWSQGWLIVKLLLVAGLVLVHHLLALWRKDFAVDRNIRPARFYRLWNEVPTALMVGIVILVIVRPF